MGNVQVYLDRCTFVKSGNQGHINSLFFPKLLLDNQYNIVKNAQNLNFDAQQKYLKDKKKMLVLFSDVKIQ